jgi:hypothetical protein
MWWSLYSHVKSFPRLPIETISIYWIVKASESIYLAGSIGGGSIIGASFRGGAY